ncbi:MAG: hypothetical protein AB3N10_06525, partial [Allomuricauda sp.]
ADETKKDEKPKKDSIFIKIYDGDRLIRTLSHKTPKKAGFHRVYWGLDEKGPDTPARKISKSKKENGGISVKPGTYKVKILYGGHADSTRVIVKTDPRIKTSLEGIQEIYDMGKKLEGYTQTAADVVKQLVQNKNLAQKFKKEMKELDKEKYKDQIKASGDIVKKIDSVVALYLGKEDKRQGIIRNQEITVMQRLNTASFYVGTRKSGITETEKKLVQFAHEELKEALNKTNSFFTNDWKPYQESIEALNLSPFKETQVFELD